MPFALLTRAARGLVARQRAALASIGYDYPVWYLLVADLGTIACAAIAVVQRDAVIPPQWPLLAGLGAIAPNIVFPFLNRVRPSGPARWLGSAIAIGAVALLLLRPPAGDPTADVAPGILLIEVAVTASSSTVGLNIPVAAATALVFAVASTTGRLSGGQVYLAAVLFCWMVGFMLRTQLRLLHQEREAQQMRASRAADAERRRIAREVHDIVGHSLAITLLHLTGARRALQEDVPADANLTDAIDALTEAERIGREAMSDIRRVVGLLNNEPAQTTPQPGAADIGDLVAAFAAAGMRVDYRVVGTLERVSGAVGGGLYRIAQESLTNVAKHAPHSDADVELRVDGQAVSLTVRNDLPARLARRQPPGSGITGMRARAEALGGELRAGPGNGWTVTARIPLAMPRTAGCRPFARERSR